MNNKDITGVNKITTGNLDVNGQIDMKGNKIIGVSNGTANSDAVNKAQLDAVETQVTSQVTTVNNKVTKNKTDITNINTINGYYYFTDQLKHKNSNIVKFPAVSNNYPYSANNKSEFLMITLSGTYHIIYTDFYTKRGQFIIHDHTNGNDLFVINIDNQSGWSPMTINSVIPINTNNGYNHDEIKLYIQTTNNAIYHGKGYSTFYIRYLHS